MVGVVVVVEAVVAGVEVVVGAEEEALAVVGKVVSVKRGKGLADRRVVGFGCSCS